MAELDVKKMVKNKPLIKRLELEYGDMHYIIINMDESVIDIDGEIWEYNITDLLLHKLQDMVWTYEEIDEFDFWPDKTRDHAPLATMWRISWYDEFDTYYHKSGATKYPENFMDLVKFLKTLR